MNVTELICACEAVVFDCAGTLLQLDPPPDIIFADAAAELGLNLRSADIVRAYELVNFALQIRSSKLTSIAAKSDFYRTFNAALCAALGIQRSFEQLHPLLTKHFAARRRWVAFEDVTETLHAIGRRVPTHVLANWDRGLDDVLKSAGVRHLLKDAAASEILGAEKPARACFDAFLIRNALNPARVLYVGNEYIADVVGAREAGLTPVLVDRANSLPYADCLRVRSLRDLVPAV